MRLIRKSVSCQIAEKLPGPIVATRPIDELDCHDVRAGSHTPALLKFLNLEEAYMVVRVSTDEFIEDFSSFAVRALTEPVTITHNGHDQLVVVSAEEYRRLKRQERKVYRTEELPDELAIAIAFAEPSPEARAFDYKAEER